MGIWGGVGCRVARPGAEALFPCVVADVGTVVVDAPAVTGCVVTGPVVALLTDGPAATVSICEAGVDGPFAASASGVSGADRGTGSGAGDASTAGAAACGSTGGRSSGVIVTAIATTATAADTLSTRVTTPCRALFARRPLGSTNTALCAAAVRRSARRVSGSSGMVTERR